MGIKQPKRLMLETEIPAFVDEIIATGCDICAIGHDGYVIGDSDLTEEEYEVAEPELIRIDEKYGDRDMLLLEIAAHLRSLGRYIDPGSNVRHWTENAKPH
ncbi:MULTISPECIES: hypothetical protein [Sinorhizobium/Ensifer group]|uniref:hypothetical protein n=1 Tax=Sinorhizobium/Ensifer group TaxID=227292 RepID=UPI0004BB53C2|nr:MULTISPECIES: hypothetical protein [Sinorhizobium/Ensifer group]ASY74383.1 hypothetical protein SF83666_d69980 [Sinorhizobium fredii CCBAU 83666]NRQ18924.1 hypothetical protein [Ensifer sesbaniae]